MKRLADLRIAETGGGTVINVGGHHAQKSPLLGTELEWLGDYLVHESPATQGSVIVLSVAPPAANPEPAAASRTSTSSISLRRTRFFA